jgi:hypothetical protein
VKRTGRDEPVGVVIHICMETAQGSSLPLQLSLSQTSKNTMCLLSFMLFSSTKSENRRAEQVLGMVRVVDTGGRREVAGKGVGG